MGDKKRRSKNGDASVAGTTSSTSTKKRSSMSRIKGLLKGRTKSKKRAGAASDSTTDVNSLYPIQEQQQQQQQQPPRGLSDMERNAAVVAALKDGGLSTKELNKTMARIPEEGASTDVDLKAKKSPKPAAPTGGVPSPLQVVLLLMDPLTRRFELLQLEFDSDKAKVSDILAQIPLSVTEDAIRKQQYRGVMDNNSMERKEGVRLSVFCKGKDILVALPVGLSLPDCTKLARPILGDDKVIGMLNASGVDTSTWSNYKEDANRAKNLPTEATKGDKNRKNGKGAGGIIRALIYVIFLALIGVAVKFGHDFISKPIELGETVSPGSWRSKCGILGFLPICENAFMQVDSDGTVNIYNAKQELTVQIQGYTGDTTDAEPNLVLGKDRVLQIAGRPAHYASTFAEDVSLHPWPFAEKPRIKLQRTTGPNFREKIFTPV